MGNAVFIVWRETIEAMLVVGILHGWLRARGQTGAETAVAFRWLWGGVAAGIALAGGLALTLLGLRSWASDAALEWFQALTPLVASILIFQMVWWMRRHGAGLKREIESGLEAAASRANWFGMALLAALAVGREGAETVIFLYGVTAAESGGRLFAGGLAGLVLALACYGLLVRGGRLFSWRVFFRVSEILLLLLGGALLVDGVGRLAGLEALPVWVNPPWADPLWDASGVLDDGSQAGSFVAAFTGWRSRPTGVDTLALALWWSLAWWTVLRTRPTRGRA